MTLTELALSIIAAVLTFAFCLVPVAASVGAFVALQFVDHEPGDLYTDTSKTPPLKP